MHGHVSTRRRFLGDVAWATAALAGLPIGSLRVSALASAPLRLTLVTGPSPGNEDRLAAAIVGARFGAAEGAHTARLVGRELSLRITTSLRLEETEDSIVLVACDADTTARLAEQAAEKGILLVNIAAPDDPLRGERCGPMLFHVCASDAMRADARTEASGEGRVVMWHPSLERFGAEQLNERFVRFARKPMEEHAWTAWMAVKVVWEATARARSSDARVLARWLESDAAHFDGHKGVPLSFRRWDHQLRQPLFIVPNDAPSGAHGAAEALMVPAGKPGDSATIRTRLDRLGTSESRSLCRADAP